MCIDAAYLYEGLLRYNYFPMVKERRDDIPPLFSTERLTVEVANRLIADQAAIKRSAARRKGTDGFDQIEYRATRFNNVSRLMHIPHPLPFVALVACLRDNWDKLDHICKSEQSQIKPKRYSDGRVLAMDEYEDIFSDAAPQASDGRVFVTEKECFPDDVQLLLRSSFGTKYVVEADVSSCFPSLYTHAISWALVGHEEAKKNRSLSAKWYNQIDYHQRQLKRNETQGVPIGPATSNIVNEIILGKVDASLAERYRFLRFIDDYKCYCETREEAEEFLRDLERQLGGFLLSLNPRKVTIKELPLPTKPAWALELSARLPEGREVPARAVVNYLDLAVALQSQHREGSVVKYAARALLSTLSERTAAMYFQYVMQLAYHHPTVLPIVCDVAAKWPESLNESGVSDQLGAILGSQISYRRSDTMCWAIYLYSLLNQTVPREAAKEIVASQDCMAMAAMLAIGQHECELIEFVTQLDASNLYELDRQWLLIHELAMRGKFSAGAIANYVSECGLRTLAGSDVSFLRCGDSECGGQGI